MKSAASLAFRAAIILVLSSLIGIGLNLASSKPLPWIYEPARRVEVAGTSVPLIDEKEARGLFGDSGTVFVDTRREEDYSKSHIQGAVSLPPHDNLQEKFIIAEPFLPKESHLILYCYGPQCEMAEEVARFLAQLGYRKMTIMNAGYRAWEKAGYPVDKRAARKTSEEDMRAD
jgi:rhodanese-related sulfurtransferase